MGSGEPVGPWHTPTTIRTSRVIFFSTEFHGCLLSHLKTPFQLPVVFQAKSPIASVSFQSDTDNCNNFLSDQAFNILRKQRDLFYEMIRIWEGSHLTPGWSFSYALSPRINQMLFFHSTPTNYAHFARLFLSQLLTMCTGDQACPIKQQDAEDLGPNHLVCSSSRKISASL
ncbi:hypothetical protein Pcinc_004914 [Petrolisthes cinctipes]|uniref:Uncharacterized protein n=1 Tax=Petrolisthes cinctipes TaxID=88211 RepID=A0AAE1GFZ2_PETCI|nr:hypothetical protein Pcinc_004914 [Petrolisthes cinctipes]